MESTSKRPYSPGAKLLRIFCEGLSGSVSLATWNVSAGMLVLLGVRRARLELSTRASH